MAELVERVRAQVKPDPRVRVLLLDERDDVRFAWPAASLPGVAPLPMNALSLQTDDSGSASWSSPRPAMRRPACAPWA